MDCDPFLGVEKAFCGHSGSQAWRGQWGEADGERGATGTERGGELQRKKSSEEKGKEGEKRKETWLGHLPNDSPAGPVFHCLGENLCPAWEAAW